MFGIKEYARKKLSSLIDSRINLYFRESYLIKPLLFGDESRLNISQTAIVNNALFNLVSGSVFVEDYVFFGHSVSVLTGTHDYNKFGRDRQVSVPDCDRDIIIKRGTWIASNATVLGGVIIGEHSVVAAGSLVKDDVPSYSIVAGIPAKVIKRIEPCNGAGVR